MVEPLPIATDDGPVPVLVFGLGGERFAVPAPYVRRIEYPAPLTPVPGGPPWLLGLANLMGEVVAVVDARRWLGLTGAVAPAGSRWLVLAYDGDLIALTIDQLPVLRFVASIQTPPAVPGGPPCPCVRAELDVGGEQVDVLDLASLLASSAGALP